MMLSPRFAEIMMKQYEKLNSDSVDTYYLSGPMTGLPDYNRPTFNEAATHLRSQGLKVWNPAEEFDSTYIHPRKFYMRKDIEALLKCQAIVMLHGWENSSGARLELEIARELEMNIFFLGDNKLTKEMS